MSNITKLRRLRRMSHFLLDKPSVTIRKSGLFFSKSAVDALNIEKFENCYISIEDGTEPEEAIKIFVEFNNEPTSEENCPVKTHTANGCYVACVGTIFNQIPRARALVLKKKSERRIFLEKDLSINTWFFPLAPQFETKLKDLDLIPEVKCIYQLVFRDNIQRIGETTNLNRRCKEYSRENIPYDEVRFSNMNNLTDEERKSWESYHLNKYAREVGALPPYNYQFGKNIN